MMITHDVRTRLDHTRADVVGLDTPETVSRAQVRHVFTLKVMIELESVE